LCKQQLPAQHPPGFNVTTDSNGLAIAHNHANPSHEVIGAHDGTEYPQNLTSFDGIDSNTFFPTMQINNGADAGNGDHHGGNNHGRTHQSILKTRCSELELINGLFRGRLAQLEAELAHRVDLEAQLRHQYDLVAEDNNQLRDELNNSHRREDSLKRRLVDFLGPQGVDLDEANDHDMTMHVHAAAHDAGVDGTGGDVDSSGDNGSPPAKRQNRGQSADVAVDPNMHVVMDEESVAHVPAQVDAIAAAEVTSAAAVAAAAAATAAAADAIVDAADSA